VHQVDDHTADGPPLPEGPLGGARCREDTSGRVRTDCVIEYFQGNLGPPPFVSLTRVTRLPVLEMSLSQVTHQVGRVVGLQPLHARMLCP
jgi:hypothetical protein